MEPARFLIRADGSARLGFGHLNRCRVLADALRGQGAEALLWVGDDPGARAFLEGADAHFSAAPDEVAGWPEGAVCVVDLYRYDAEYYRRIGEHFARLALFDDVEFRVPDPVGAVINGNVYASPDRYPAGVRAFAGPEYYLLRSEFAGRSRRGEADRVFLCMGGSDPEGQTERLLRLLLSHTRRPITVVSGPGAPAPGGLVELAPSRVRVHRAPDRLAPLMEEALYAVSAAGTVLYELAHLGVPTACLCLAPNQALAAKAFGRLGAALPLGEYSTVSDAELAEGLKRLDRSADLRSRLGARTAALIDGKGPDRLALGLLAWARGDVPATTYSAVEIAEEYDRSALEGEEHARVKWGSRESMVNRFAFSVNRLPFGTERSWLDVGCGTGAFQAFVGARFPALRRVGLDLSTRLLEQAAGRRDTAGTEFVRGDFLEFTAGPFDLVTAIGVLQKTTCTPARFFRKAAELLRPGGRVLVSTKHAGWKRFAEAGFEPEPSHSWFSGAELEEAVGCAGLRLLSFEGFLPKENLVVPPEESHDVFLLAERPLAG